MKTIKSLHAKRRVEQFAHKAIKNKEARVEGQKITNEGSNALSFMQCQGRKNSQKPPGTN